MIEKNYFLPSCIAPLTLSFLIVFINPIIYNLEVKFDLIKSFQAIIFFSLFTFPLVNIFGWPAHFLLIYLKQDNYIASGLLGGAMGSFIFTLLTFGEGLDRLFLATLSFFPLGVITGLLFRFLIYYRRCPDTD